MQRRASMSAIGSHDTLAAPDARSVETKESIPEASLFEIMQRVGISCTKQQVEKLQLLGVTIQRK